ncbi:hypothetical protein E2562_023774 [Oryza meyeriana var. granulata]|uniref:Uncharacterized protein n=1 Tax=Oryza meyeriana var. granulata TaxID=110450 RepID=A0A6G1DMF2_9ORYZ|nr:hypothetical protein E2562_023774 [Oryza meyeriana var. granulata]
MNKHVDRREMRLLGITQVEYTALRNPGDLRLQLVLLLKADVKSDDPSAGPATCVTLGSCTDEVMSIEPLIIHSGVSCSQAYDTPSSRTSILRNINWFLHIVVAKLEERSSEWNHHLGELGVEVALGVGALGGGAVLDGVHLVLVPQQQDLLSIIPFSP